MQAADPVVEIIDDQQEHVRTRVTGVRAPNCQQQRSERWEKPKGVAHGDYHGEIKRGGKQPLYERRDRPGYALRQRAHANWVPRFSESVYEVAIFTSLFRRTDDAMRPAKLSLLSKVWKVARKL